MMTSVSCHLAANLFISTLAALLSATVAVAQPWTYIEVDDSRQKWGDWAEPGWLRYFGLDARDLNGDGLLDLVSGRYVYVSPGADLAGSWERYDLGQNVDGVLLVDVDGDQLADVIATALPDVYWFEATDAELSGWRASKVARITATGHVNGQGARVADIVGGGEPEVLVAGGDGVYLIALPRDAEERPWRARRLFEASDEGFAVGDIDSDGDLDIAASQLVDGEPRRLFWWENPGDLNAPGSVHMIHDSVHPIDRIEIADFNGDGHPDVVYSQERYPGKEPDARLVLLEAPVAPSKADWVARVLATQYSMNNLDVADLDGDGDVDIVTSEHKGPDLRLQMFENQGGGEFRCVEIDRGREMHLGARLADLDGDGDLDIFGHAWDNHRYLHLWRNDRVR